MSAGQHRQANKHYKGGSRGGRLGSKLGVGVGRRPLWKVLKEVKKAQRRRNDQAR